MASAKGIMLFRRLVAGAAAAVAACALAACSSLDGETHALLQADAGSVVRAETGDTIVLDLVMPEEEGRIWTELNEAFNVKVLARKGCVHLVPDAETAPPGARRMQRFVYRVIGPGHSGISVVSRSLSRPDEPDRTRLDYLVVATGEPEEAAGDPIPPPPGPKAKYEVDSKGVAHPIKGVFD